MADKDTYAVSGGQAFKADGTIVNVADLIEPIDGKVIPKESAIVAAGFTYAAGGRDTAVAAGSSQSLHLENPAASGKNLHVTLITTYTDNTNSLSITFLKNGTSSGGTLTPFNLLTGKDGTDSVAVVRFGTDALSGSTPINISADVTQSAPYRLKTTIIVEQGTNLAIETTVPGALSTSSIAMNVSWTEVAA